MMWPIPQSGMVHGGVFVYGLLYRVLLAVLGLLVACAFCSVYICTHIVLGLLVLVRFQFSREFVRPTNSLSTDLVQTLLMLLFGAPLDLYVIRLPGWLKCMLS